jgi:putative acetyltransferase
MLVLRSIQSSDNEELAQLIRDTMEEFGVCGENTSAADREIDEMYEAYSRQRHAFFVWDRDGHIVGGGGIGPLNGGDEHTCELRKMYLHPELRGKGKGRELLQQCLDAARQFGFANCYLETMEQMGAAKKLYERMGFEECQSPMGATGHQCHRWMIKSLT